jgi:endonuclease/exonuclease/phosphatase family metal-dependent hydrolase
MLKPKFALALLAAAAAAPTHAAPVNLGVASFNMAWAGTEADFAAHLQVCSTAKWCDTRPRRARGEATASLAAVEEARQCVATMEAAAGGARKSMMLAPCNAYRNAANPPTAADYAQKMAGLRATVEKLIDDGVHVIAFQEVKSDETVRAVLGKHAANFATCAAPHNAFQTVAFAWDKRASTRPGVCTPRRELAVKEDPAAPGNERQLRPGLALELEVGGKPLTIMTVHLKSSCANLADFQQYKGRKLTDMDSHCRIFNRQVAPLEAWIESVEAGSPRFILLGDFNRRIDEEAEAKIDARSVRADGSDPAGAHPLDAHGYTNSQVLWQEISDGKPSLFQVPLGGKDASCKGFTGLDHIVVSPALHALQDPAAFTSRKVGVVELPGQKIESSDHCPRVVKLAL